MELDEENPLKPSYRYAIGNRVRMAFLEKWLPQMKGQGFNFGAGSENPFREIQPQPKMWRMDIDPAAVKNLDMLSDIQRVGIKSESLDWVLCSEVIEHVPDFKAALQEIHRCLKPSGKVILTVPFSIPLHGEPYDFWRFTDHAVVVLCKETGFKINEIEALGNFSTFYWQTLSLEYHRRFAWVPKNLSSFKRLVLKFLSATVPFFSSFCYAMAFRKKNNSQRGNVLSWGAILEKP